MNSIKEIDEIKEISDAHERAARSVQSGSAAALNGRFDAELEEVSRVVHRVCDAAQRAQRLWGHWRAINDALTPPNETGNALIHSDLAHPLGDIRYALADRALLLAYALTDPVRKDLANHNRETLPALAKLLLDGGMRERVATAEWLADLGFKPRLIPSAAELAKKKTDRFFSMVTPDWQKLPPSETTLVDLRVAMKPVRDHALAHSLDDRTIEKPLFDEVQSFIQLVAGLATDIRFAVTGEGSDSDEHCATQQTTDFWKVAFAEPLRRLEEHKRHFGLVETNTAQRK